MIRKKDDPVAFNWTCIMNGIDPSELEEIEITNKEK